MIDVGRAYATAWRVAPRLPERLVRAMAALAADVAWLRRGVGVRRLEANLARVRPDADGRELRRLSRAGMRSYLRYFAEVFTLPGRTPQQVDARVRATGDGPLRERLAAGEQVVLALGHLGNWDLAGAWATRNLAVVTTVAERLEPEQVFTEFLALRERFGLRIIALDPHGGGGVFRQLLQVCRTGPGVLPLLADRDLTSNGVEVALFGERARVAAGPAALAVATGAPLSATVVHYERLRGARRRAAGSPWGVVVEFGPILAVDPDLPKDRRVAALTQAWVDQLAAGIAAHPADWHMLQRVFVDDLDPDRYARTVAGHA